MIASVRTRAQGLRADLKGHLGKFNDNPLIGSILLCNLCNTNVRFWLWIQDERKGKSLRV
jgi:hypothetical protein